MSDFDEPDRDMVEMRLAARHSGTPGRVPDTDLQETCHFRSITADVLKLKNPSCVLQEEQNTFRLRASVSVRSWVFGDPCSMVDGEN